MASRKIPDITRLDDTARILLVRLFALGDIVLTLPLVRRLRDAFPRAWIGYLCRGSFAGALRGETGLDEVLVTGEGASGWLSTVRDLRRRRISLAIDLLSSPRSAVITGFSGAAVRIGFETGRHDWCFDRLLPRSIDRDGERLMCYTLDSNLEYAAMLGVGDGSPVVRGKGDTDPYPVYGFPAADPGGSGAEEILSTAGEAHRGYFGLVTGAKYGSKSWPAERFAELASAISLETGMRPVIVWGPGEEDSARRMAAAVPGSLLPPPTGIPELGALVSRMRMVVGVDSGPKHIAVLLGVPTVTLFGPTDPVIWDPLTERHRAVSRRVGCAEGCREKECADNICMKEITVEEVMEEVRSLPGIRGSGQAGRKTGGGA